jgi:2-dehydro-3-deoxyphosphogluconate aldolase / (4S)-4-hydroxy-2-oxoglutarate aldolase
MDRNETIKQVIRKQGLLPLFYHPDQEVCIEITRALFDVGIRVIEFTNRGEAALSNFRAIVKERNSSMKDLLLAVGTIRTSTEATSFIEAGADFLVSPVFDADVADIAYIQKILWIPGCMTPTEIHEAEKAGCTLIKLFPGNMLGPSFVSAIKELFPKLEFIPTGGVDTAKKNLEEWFSAGVCAVGMGSKLISKKQLEKKQYDKIATETKKLLKTLRSIKKN